MRGRKPKSAELKRAQGNPGHRRLLKVEAAEVVDVAAVSVVFDFAKLTVSARRIYDVIGTSLRQMNFVKTSDEPMLVRYCETLARYWKVTHELDQLGGESYECKTTTGETMQRIRPQFLVQDRLARRLEPMEDRLGLSPMARQQYLTKVFAAGAQGNLPGTNKPATGSPIGMLNPPQHSAVN